MSDPVRILLVEDLPTDARLAEREIRKALPSCVFECVDTRETLLAALSEFRPDLVITDYRMPRFDGLTALKLTLENSPITPVIVLTSAINEDTAVECMKSGATDYVIKEHIKRLGQAVLRALEEKQVRLARMEAERDLRIRNFAVESSISAIALADLNGLCIYANDAFLRMWHESRREDVIGKPLKDLFLQGDDEDGLMASLGKGRAFLGEEKGRRSDGSSFDTLVSAGTVWDHDGEPLCLMLSMLDVTERRLAVQALRDSEEKYRRFFEDNMSGVYLSTPEGTLLACNEAFARIMGYDSPSKLLAVNAEKMYETREHRERFLERLKAARRLLNAECELVRRDGSKVQVVENVVGEFNESGELVRFLGSVFDISERRLAEQALKESEQRFHDIFRFAPVGICQAARDGTFRMANTKLAQILGHDSVESLMGMNLAQDVFRDPAEGVALLAALDSSESESSREFRWKRKNGESIWVNLSMHTVRDPGGNLLFFEGFVADISDRKRIEIALRGSLEEKETLLREIHHRVKNNLQIVSSLLSLQAQELPDPSLQRAFGESQNRIRSMAMIHEQLYRSSSLANIDFAPYVKEIATKLAQSHGEGKVEITVDVRNVLLNLERAIPCGLIVNELVTNALKHAFTGRDHGCVGILMRVTEEGDVECRVEDDGVGFPNNRRFEEMPSMGSALVCGLVDQLQGSLEVQRGKGTAFVVRFPLNPRPSGGD